MITMRKPIVIIATVLSGLMILDSLQVGHAITMFLLAGVIPGTNLVLSPTVTLELFALLLGFVMSRIVINVMRQAAQAPQSA
jgi:hypothetical protein